MYTKFFRFSENPFKNVPDPRFFCIGRTNEAALDGIMEALERPGELLVVTGERGVGKTVTMRFVLEHVLDERFAPVWFPECPRSETELVQHALRALSVQPPEQADAKTLLNALLRQAAALRAQSKRLLLVIDEAERLDVRLARLLVKLAALARDGDPLLQVALVGDESLLKILEKGEGRLRVVRIAPLDLKDLRGYFLHRLKVVGWNGHPEIDEGLFLPLFEASGGNPREVNRLADRLLSMAMLYEAPAVTAELLSGLLASKGAAARTHGAVTSTQEPSATSIGSGNDTVPKQGTPAGPELAPEQDDLAADEPSPRAHGDDFDLERLEAEYALRRPRRAARTEGRGRLRRLPASRAVLGLAFVSLAASGGFFWMQKNGMHIQWPFAQAAADHKPAAQTHAADDHERERHTETHATDTEHGFGKKTEVARYRLEDVVTSADEAAVDDAELLDLRQLVLQQRKRRIARLDDDLQGGFAPASVSDPMIHDSTSPAPEPLPTAQSPVPSPAVAFSALETPSAPAGEHHPSADDTHGGSHAPAHDAVPPQADHGGHGGH